VPWRRIQVFWNESIPEKKKNKKEKGKPKNPIISKKRKKEKKGERANIRNELENKSFNSTTPETGKKGAYSDPHSSSTRGIGGKKGLS